MISYFFLVAGIAVLSMALRSFRHPLLHRLGTLGVVFTSFLAGWLIGGHIAIGLAFAAAWFLLPWLEILTRIRKMRLPAERVLKPHTPPTQAVFPGFRELTEDVENNQFEHVEDVGWELDDNKQFFRIFYHEPTRTQTSICLIEQSNLAFYYLSISSRHQNGKVYISWNYPFSSNLLLPPHLTFQRIVGELPFEAMLQQHQDFLKAQGVSVSDLTPDGSAEALLQGLQADMHAQVRHNLDVGLLAREGEHHIRYTLRGMFYLWLQFIRDFVRLS